MLGTEALDSFNTISILVRFVIAVIFGGVIGIERTRKGRAAGFRTHILVCIGAASVMMTSLFLMEFIDADTDLSRMGAQVISGIGFLGAGTIIVTGKREVRGLTTAAGLWTDACMGLAIGAGFYSAAILMLVLVLAVMTVLDMLEGTILIRTTHKEMFIVIRTPEDIRHVLQEIKRQNIELLQTMICEVGDAYKTHICLRCSVRIPRDINIGRIEDLLQNIEGVLYIEESQ